MRQLIQFAHLIGWQFILVVELHTQPLVDYLAWGSNRQVLAYNGHSQLIAEFYSSDELYIVQIFNA